MKRISRFAVWILIIATLVVSMPVTAFAASAPSIFVDYDETPDSMRQGTVGELHFTIFPEYHNEKYHVHVYRSNGSKVGSVDTQYYNSDGTYIKNITITVDTDDLDMGPGRYKVEYWLSYYTYGSWRTGSKKYYYFDVIASTCTGAHTYDNACDTTCNVCTFTREITHKYSGDCDTVCNICNFSRSPIYYHSYSSSSDTSCNVCGYIYSTAAGDGSQVIASGICGANLTWILSAQGQLTISGSGDMYDYSSENSPPWKSCRARISSVVIEEGVTSIGKCAFYYMDYETVSIASTVTKMGNDCFSNAKSLRSVVLPSGISSIPNYAFLNCTSLESIVIPASVQSFGTRCFEGCESLTSFIIPSGVTKIPYGMFTNCSGLECVQIPSSVTSIDSYAFNNCAGLSDVYYAGTQSQYNAITITDLSTTNEGLVNATIHYESYIPCETCVYGDYISVDDESHARVCVNCTNKETASHVWNEGELIQEATCQADGSITYTCTVCAAEKVEVIPSSSAHTYGSCSIVSGTHHKQICTNCAYENIVEHVWNDGLVTKEPTCVEEGTKVFVCTLCNAVKIENIATSDVHQYGDWASHDSELHVHTCQACQAQETAPHTWNAGTMTQKPANGQPGIMTYTCTACGATTTAEVNFILGDANGDGKVNLRDAIMVLQASNGKDVSVDRSAADVTGDGRMNLQDAIRILKRANGNTDPFPAEKEET